MVSLCCEFYMLCPNNPRTQQRRRCGAADTLSLLLQSKYAKRLMSTIIFDMNCLASLAAMPALSATSEPAQAARV